MFLYGLFLLLLSNGEHALALAPIPDAIPTGRGAQLVLGPGSSFLAASDQLIYHWDRKGLLIRQLEPGGKVVFFTYHSGLYIVTTQKENSSPQTQFYDRNGMLISMSATSELLVFSYLNMVDDRYFSPLENSLYFKKNNFGFLSREVRFLRTSGGLVLTKTGAAFSKANERMHDLFFKFNRIYLAKAHSTSQKPSAHFLVMNQLENRIYFYDPETIKREHIDGQRVPTPVPFVTLGLPKYKPPPLSYFSPELVIYEGMREKKVDKAFLAWGQGLGLIRYFSTYRDGYVTTYEIPEYDGAGVCSGYHLGIQRLSADFATVGNLLEVDTPLIAPFRVKDEPQQIAIFVTQTTEEGGMTHSILFKDL